ncbi:MAG TPA: Flp family type IVb pilin [Acidimicrobiia bacterium]|nr:Flp family type IVb pilin [Acidimicrobiia bacterium]
MLRLFVAMQSWFAGLREEERGATAVEYGIMVALIAAVIVGVVTLVGTDVKKAFDTVEKALP